MEDGILNGGLYTNILDLLSRNNLEEIEVIPFGYNDSYVTHGKIDELENWLNISLDYNINIIEREIKYYNNYEMHFIEI